MCACALESLAFETCSMYKQQKSAVVQETHA
jgi:hypothetical protein